MWALTRSILAASVLLCLAGCDGGGGEAATDAGAGTLDVAARSDAGDVSAPDATTLDATSTGDVASETAVAEDAGPDATVALDGDAGDAATADVAPDTFVSPWPHGCVEAFCAAGPESAPDPSTWGPFPIGVKTFTTELVDYLGGAREIVVDVWYPATEASRDGPFEEINLKARATPEALAQIPEDLVIPPIPSQAVRDADIRTFDGPYPLVVFSHGAYGVRFQSVYFTAVLASHGYVVVSPDHTGNSIWELIAQGGYSQDSLGDSMMNRTLDVQHLIGLMKARSADGADFFGGTVDGDNVGVSGHSFGGLTSLIVAFQLPEVKVILPMAPASGFVPIIVGDDLENLPLPMMIMADALDQTLDYETEMKRPYELSQTLPKHYLEFVAGGHFTFTNICTLDLVTLAEELSFDDAENALTDGCADFNTPIDLAHAIIDQFGIGFLNFHLRKSPGSKVYFDQAAADELAGTINYMMEE